MRKLKTRKRILAIMLVLVMITQNAWSIMADVTQQDLDQRSGESVAEVPEGGTDTLEPENEQAPSDLDTQVEESTDSNAGGSVDDSGLADGTQGDDFGTENSTDEEQGANAAAYLSSSVTQEIFQLESNGVISNYVQLTAQVTNMDSANDAYGVDVKVLLPEQVYYVNAGNETGGMSAFNNPAEVYGYTGFDLDEVPQGVMDAHSNGQVMMWLDQAIGAGQTAVYTFTAEIAQGITSVQGLDSAWYVNGSSCSYSWYNTELLTPAAEEPAMPDETEDGSQGGTEDGTQDGSQGETEDGTQEGTEDGTQEGTEDGTQEGTEDGSQGGTEDENQEETEDGTQEGTEDGSQDGTPGADDGELSDDSEESKEAYKTEFTYFDDYVIITAAAAEEAQLSQDTVLKAVRMEEGSAFYDNAVTTAESQLGAVENADYVCYDVYFELDGEKIEPKAGTVTINMNFRDTVFEEKSIEDTSDVDVIHINEKTGVAENVTDSVSLTGDGDVSAVGFTTDSLSPILLRGNIKQVKAPEFKFDTEVPDKSYSTMDEFIYSAEMSIYDANGDPVTEYNPAKDSINASGGSFELTIKFKESEAWQMDENFYLVYNIPAALNIVNDIGPNNLEWQGGGSDYLIGKYGVPGAFKVEAANNKLYVQMNQDFVKAYTNVVGDVKMRGSFKRQSTGDGSATETIKIGDATFTLNFDGNPIEAVKSVSTYDEEKGFLFTIDVTSYGKPTNVVITDILGENLELVNGSVKIDGQHVGTDISVLPYVTSPFPEGNKTKFTIALTDESLIAGGSPRTVRIQYYAKIKESALKPNSGAIPGLDNTAIIKQGGDFTDRTVTAQGSYYIDWITKAAGTYSDDGTVQWTLTINRDRKADTTGVTVKDVLTGGGLRYDTRRPIHVVVDKGSDQKEEYDINWGNTNGLTYTDTSWDYKIPDEKAGKYAYTFTYYTVVKAGGSAESYGNMGSITKNDSSVDTGIIVGPGTGTGNGIITKRFENQITGENGEKYAQWSAVIKVPATGLTNVVFKDKLSGAHEFPKGITAGKAVPNVSSEGYSTESLKVTRNSETEMTILFGSETEADSELPSKEKEYEVKITYYTLLKGEGVINNSASVSSEQKNGFTDSTEEIKKYSFAKNGSANTQNPKLLDWQITLSDNLDNVDIDNVLEIRDVIKGAHTYVERSAKLLRRTNANDNSPTDFSRYLNEEQTGDGVKFTIDYPLSSRFIWTIEYQTRIANETTETSFGNEADIYLSGKNIGNAEDSVGASSNYISKELNQKATVGNSYKAKYSVVVDGTTLGLDESKEAVYTITDYSDVYVKIQESTIKVQEKVGNDWNDVPFGYVYTTDVTDPKNNKEANKLEVTINTTGGKVYRLQYDALIVPDDTHKPNSNGVLTYSNRAEFQVGQRIFDDDVKEDVTIEASGSGSSGADNSYIIIYKKNAATNKAMAGAGFVLKKYNPESKQYENISEEAVTDVNGKAAFGQQTDGLQVPIVSLKGEGLVKGAVYLLEEKTVPAGYKKAEDIVFIYGEAVDKNTTIYTECGLIQDGKVLNGAIVGNTAEVAVNNEELVNINTVKNWEEEDTLHPLNVTVNLITKANGKNITLAGITTSAQLEDSNNWTASWANLPKYYKDTNNKYYEIEYSVEEEEIKEGGKRVYTPVIACSTKNENGVLTYAFEILNIRSTENTSFQVIKQWNDNNNSDGQRPEKIWVQLQKKVGNGEFTDVKDFTYDYSVVENGKVIKKSVKIVGLVELYNSNNWRHEWKILPGEESGEAVEYRAVEGIYNNGVFTPESQSPIKEGYKQTGNEIVSQVQTFTNSYTWEKVNIPVQKVWDTKGDSDGESKIPQSIQVELKAKIDGKYVDLNTVAGNAVSKTITLKEENSWNDSSTWTDLPKYYRQNGVSYEIEYEPVEITQLNNGWTYTRTELVDGVYNLTNTFTNSTSISASKSWDDNKNQDGKRPTSITFTLYRPKLDADGELTPSSAGTSGEEKIIEGYVYEPYMPDGGQSSIDLTGDAAAATWGPVTWNNLPPKWGYVEGAAEKLKDTKIAYKVLETNITYKQNQDEKYNTAAGYPKVEEKSEGNFVITNQYIPEEISVKASKIWEDKNNQDGLRDNIESIKLSLQQSVYNGKGYGTYKNVTFPKGSNEKAVYEVPADDLKTNWEKTWSGLDKYVNGKTARYKVVETITYKSGETRKYTTSYNGKPDTYVTGEDENPEIKITNSYVPQSLNITANKYWDDENDRDRVRQYVESITFTLNSRTSGETAWREQEKAVFKGKDAWADNATVTWKDLAEYNEGVKIEYSVTETVEYSAAADAEKKYLPPKYSQEIITRDSEEKTVTITNTYKPETVAVNVEKIWEDFNNKDGYRPDGLKVKLMMKSGKLEDGTPTYTEVTEFPAAAVQKQNPVTLRKGDDWKGGWDTLYKYKDGVEIEYAAAEVKDYSNNERYTETTSSEENPVFENGTYTFILKNEHKEDRKDLSVVKFWDDNENEMNTRPEDVQVRLLADGKPVKDYTIITENGEQGQITTEYKGTVTLSEENGWSYEWKELPVNNDKDDPDSKTEPIKYTVEELTQFAEDTYTVSYDYGEGGMDSWSKCTVKNSYKTEKTSVFLMKLWRDGGSQSRPTEAKFQLYKQVWEETEPGKGAYGNKIPVGGVVTIKGTKTSNIWRYTWADLDRKENKDDDHEILYTVEEVEVPQGYQVLMSGEENVFTAINIETKVEISKRAITGENELPGAKLALYDKKALESDAGAAPVETWTSADTPHIIRNLTVGGNYILKETAAPKGYTLAQDIEFTVEPDGKVQKVIMHDVPTEVKVSKKALTGTEETALSGADLRIVDENGETAQDINGNPAQWTTSDTPAVITGLPAGMYTLEEVNAPAGYYVAEDIKFELTEAGEILVDGKSVEKIEMIDYPTNIYVSKKDLTGEAELPGAELALYRIQKKQESEPSEKETEEEVLVEEWTSTDKPHVIKGLLIGEEYILRERKAPSGYNVAQDIRFTVTEAGAEVPAAEFTQLVTMFDAANDIFVSKKSITGENELPGAVLQIWQGENLIDEWTSGTDPHNVGIKLSTGESYTLHEKSAPAGYLVAEDIHFTVQENGAVIGTAEPVSTIILRDKPRTVKVLKKDEEGNFVKGAKLLILDKEGKIIEPIWETDGTAREIKAALNPGQTYILREEEAPAGYTAAPDIEFSVDEVTELVEITMTDKKTKITVSKKEITGEESLGGAVLRILDKDGKEVIKPWTTEAGKDRVFEGILNVNEEYTLEEVTPPDYYGKAESIKFTIDESGKLLINEKEAEAVVMRDAKTRVRVSKLDLTDEAELVGAILQIIDKETNAVVEEWTTTAKPHYVEGKLIVGRTYILHEKFAPEGYGYADDIEFVVKEDSVEGNEQKVTMRDAKNVVLITKTDISGTKELPGARLQLLDKNGNILESWTSTNEEYKITSKLSAGEKYILRELEAPDGYWLADDVTFTVNKDGKPTYVVMKDAPTRVEILKVDENGSGLAGAQLVLKDDNGKMIDKWTSDGKAHVLEKTLVAGAAYTLTELSAPTGYELADDVKFTVSEKQQTIRITMKDMPETNKNGRISVKKRVTLVDLEGDVELRMKDAVFYVGLFTDKAGTKPYGAVKAITLKNAVSGTAVFNNLPSGTYYVYETDASGKIIPYDELQKDSDGKEYACVADGTPVSVELNLKANVAEGNVNLNNRYYELPEGFSYDAFIDLSKKVLRGTSQTTVNDTFYAGIFTKDVDGSYEIYQVVQLRQNGTVSVQVGLGGEKGMDPITYYVFETDAKGIPVDLDVFEYEVSGEGKVTLSTSNTRGEITIVNRIPETEKGKLIFQKVDGNGVGLAGAQFRILDANGSVVQEWISEASARSVALNPGKYTLKELKAPTGYTGGGDVIITVNEDYTISASSTTDVSFSGNVLKYVNKVIPGGSVSTVGGGKNTTGSGPAAQKTVNTVGGKYVKTGDDTPIGFYLALLAAAALLAGTVIIKRRKQKQEK